jgi:hypothetical protein
MSYTIKYKSYITRSDVQTNRESIFVFGDNDQRSGFGGQAKEMRGEPNVVGIRVKKYPSMNSDAFYKDSEYKNNIIKIAEDINNLEKQAYNKTIVFPSNGIGTGMAKLNITSPKTFEYLTTILKNRFDIINGKE